MCVYCHSTGRLLLTATQSSVAWSLDRLRWGRIAQSAAHGEGGKVFFEEGNFEKARVEFRNALQIVPTRQRGAL
jgi:hypothetical protein